MSTKCSVLSCYQLLQQQTQTLDRIRSESAPWNQFWFPKISEKRTDHKLLSLKSAHRGESLTTQCICACNMFPVENQETWKRRTGHAVTESCFGARLWCQLYWVLWKMHEKQTKPNISTFVIWLLMKKFLQKTKKNTQMWHFFIWSVKNGDTSLPLKAPLMQSVYVYFSWVWFNRWCKACLK